MNNPTNQALPHRSAALLEDNLDVCQNLGLLLDKYAPWQPDPRKRGLWDLTMKQEQRRRGQTSIQDVTGGQAKGLWLRTKGSAKRGETKSLFEDDRTDIKLTRAKRDRWLESVKNMDGTAFAMPTIERLVVGLGASHVLETAITLDRGTGAPYLPGSSLKGLARAQALFELAAAFGVTLDEIQVNGEEKTQLAHFETALMAKSEAKNAEDQNYKDRIEVVTGKAVEGEALQYVDLFRFIFGTTEAAGQVVFLDGIYAGDSAPRYVADVMTPHYVNYYSSQEAPAEDQEPQPVTFLTVDKGNLFWFGLLPRPQQSLNKNAPGAAAGWLVSALTELGAGGKTAAGYGYFSRKRMEILHQPGE